MVNPAERNEAPRGKALSDFIDASLVYVREKRMWLRTEFGVDDYGVKGAIVVGSVASGTERPDSDLDVYVLAEDVGDVHDFIDGVGAKIDRIIDLIDVVELSKGQVFTPQDWSSLLEEKGYYSTDFYRIDL